jgi:serine/threonine-protein kinase
MTTDERRASGRIEVGEVLLGRYELRRELGRTAQAVVFEGVHTFTGRSVAVKLVVADAPAAARSELAARLRREARALASVQHPGVVEVLDGGTLADGTPFFVMEMLDGRTVEGLLTARGKFPVVEAVALGLALADALAAAHAAGVVHRDVQPSNVLVVRDHARREVVKLLDFGIARVTAKDAGAKAPDRLTGIGAVIGAPAYMSPEQLLGLDDVDARSDVYSLGVTLFECLTGKVPYEGSYQEVVLEVCSERPVPELLAAEPTVPRPVAAVVQRAMTKDRAARYATMRDFEDALRASAPGARTTTELFGPREAPKRAEQRRKLPRAPYVTPVRIVVGDITIDGRTEDISTGGLLVVCHQVCPTEKTANLRFALPIEGRIASVDVQVRWVKAARANDPTGPRALGVEFVGPPPEMVASIARYVTLMGANAS